MITILTCYYNFVKSVKMVVVVIHLDDQSVSVPINKIKNSKVFNGLIESCYCNTATSAITTIPITTTLLTSITVSKEEGGEAKGGEGEKAKIDEE